MKKTVNAIKTFFTNPTYVFVLGLLVALLATTIEVVRGRNTNYFDYQDATRMFWEGISPYTLEFVQAHCIHFLYLPVFCVVAEDERPPPGSIWGSTPTKQPHSTEKSMKKFRLPIASVGNIWYLL